MHLRDLFFFDRISVFLPREAKVKENLDAHVDCEGKSKPFDGFLSQIVFVLIGLDLVDHFRSVKSHASLSSFKCCD